MLFTLLLISAVAFADGSQVLLRSDKTEYKQGEIVLLSYETLWLGPDDGQMRFSSTAFPEIEVRSLNMFPVELTETRRVESLPEPSRHEGATFAPAMSRLSDEFAINDADAPTMFLSGRQGYYQLDRPGTYVIRAVFRAGSDWRLFDGQESDVFSSAIVVIVHD